MSALTDAIAHELAHPPCTMDDPLTASIAQLEADAAAARASGAVTDILADSEREWEWLPLAGVIVVALVSLASWLWPLAWGAK